ncbi:MAG: hypothetical protein LBQ61_07865, partial [Spirochaetales bacterium]|nr:hypothetical protein [Spirochaetales bacterium]
DILRLDAQITWTGKTSLEVRVDSYVERLGGGEKWINRAYLVFVALNPDGSSAPVVPFVPRTEAEKSEWAQAERRRQIRLETRRD